jgi:hypothetical protein
MDRTPSVPLKMSPDAQNMKMGPDSLGTAEKEFVRVKYEIGSQRPRYRRKRIWALKTLKWEPTATVPQKTIPGAPKHEIETRRPPYRRKRARECIHENETRCPRYRRKRVMALIT